MNDKVLVLNAAPKIDKLYTIMGKCDGRLEEKLDIEVPGLAMAQEACHHFKNKYGSAYDVWIVEQIVDN